MTESRGECNEGRRGALRYPALRYRWQWDLESDRDSVWPLVAETNRFNRDSGLPPVEPVATAAGGPGLRRLRLRRLGVSLEWEEEPFEWVRPERFGVVRRYTHGPLAELRTRAELEPLPSGGTRLRYEVDARPRNLAGLLAVPVQIGLLARRRFGQTFRRYDRLALARPGDGSGGARLAPGGRRRLAAARAALTARGAEPELVARLVEAIERGGEDAVVRLRPYALADEWGSPRRTLLELCLEATRGGLLELRWDLMCPACRGAAESVGTLAEIQSRVHCESCGIGFGASFDRSVEVSFRPSPAVREVEARHFCVGGPELTPHVAVQQLLRPGESRAVSAALEPGGYRVRARGIPGGRGLTVRPDAGPEVALRIESGGWPDPEAEVSPDALLLLENATDERRLLAIERTAWRDDAATAADVTALQTFRDLFASEALRSDETIAVGSLTVVFTDLRESTRFYREIGDAPAFASVLGHLGSLREAVAGEGGAVVKTMGDAIMAVFPRPAPAIRALLQAQRQLAAPEAPLPLALKVGIHHGPCIAVTQNDRPDYFGSTVNAAARLVGLSSGAEIVVSEAVVADPEVRALLGELAGEVAVERLDAQLSGRLRRRALPALPAASGFRLRRPVRRVRRPGSAGSPRGRRAPGS